jgi:hypothetical protein
VSDDRPFGFTRRQIIQAAAMAGIGSALGARAVQPALGQPLRPADLAQLAPELRRLQQRFLEIAARWTASDRLARGDGYVYAVDVGQLMICFAQARDASNYTKLVDRATHHLVCDVPKEPYSRGFVAWRHKEGQPNDASGTTEALRLARGLWLGAKQFGRPGDAALALAVLDGYARHAMNDQGVWIICNYFNFNTHGFATNSFLVDYDPDFLSAVADERKDAVLARLAEQSYDVVRKAVAPSGLLYDLLQPELKTLYPELDVVAFSPNDIVQFSNCACVAATIARGLPQVARRVLAFALDRMQDLRIFYFGRTGEPVNDRPAGIFELCTLARLAMGLGSPDSAAAIAAVALPKWTYFAEHNEPTQAYLVSEILMALHELLRS